MDHTVCLNTNSFPASNPMDAYELFYESLQGLLALNTGTDRYILYFDSASSESLSNFNLSEGFTYSAFREKLIGKGERDLVAFLDEMDDKSPAMDYLPDDIMEDIASYDFYMPNHSVEKYPDIFGYSYFLHAVMLSIPTEEKWDTHKIHIARVSDNGRYSGEKLPLRNIAKYEHGEILYDEANQININDVCKKCCFTDDFISWYEEQSKDNCHRIIDKLRLASERNFNGGEPLFKSLEDGLREIRFSAYPGGAIRILFKVLDNSEQAVLLGFIKKSNRDGYDENIPKALRLFGEC